MGDYRNIFPHLFFPGMKKRTLIRKDAEKAPVPEGLKEFFRKVTFQSVVTKETEKKVYESQIRDYENELSSARINLEKTTKDLEKIAANKEAMEEKSNLNAEELYKKFSKNICFNSFDIGDYLSIRTNLLFADIRKNAGSRLHKRACLGAYQIILPTPLVGMARDYVWVDNLTFRSSKAHWAISANRICWGGWASEIEAAMKKRDYYQMFEVIVSLIRAADDDAGAYLRSHEWRDRRDISKLTELTGDKIAPGDYVIFTGIEQDGLEILGHTAFVNSMNGNVMQCTIKEIGNPRQVNFQWQVLSEKAMKITEEMFNAQSKYKIKSYEANPTAKIIKSIDEMPEGTPNSEAIKVAKEMASCKEIHLDIKKLMK